MARISFGPAVRDRAECLLLMFWQHPEYGEPSQSEQHYKLEVHASLDEMAAWLENYPCCPLFSARDSRPQIREGLKRLADIGMLKRHQLSRQPEANKIWHFTLIFPRTPMSREILEDFRQRWSQARPTPAKPNFAVHTPPSFLGRDQDTQELWQRYLAGERLILLYGAAGVGKTALARHVVQRFEHIIELVPSTDPMLEFPLPAWLAFQVQHWGETPQREWPLLLEQWRYCLQQRACGVLVDGVERILDPDQSLPTRLWLDWLHVLAHPRNRGLALLTSSVPIQEPQLTTKIYHLGGLPPEVWQALLQADASAEQIERWHQQHQGNARILRQRLVALGTRSPENLI